MSADLFEKVRDALAERKLVLVGSLGRAVLVLSERGRVNVVIQDSNNNNDTATLYLQDDGSLVVQLSGEMETVAHMPQSTRRGQIRRRSR